MFQIVKKQNKLIFFSNPVFKNPGIKIIIIITIIKIITNLGAFRGLRKVKKPMKFQ